MPTPRPERKVIAFLFRRQERVHISGDWRTYTIQQQRFTTPHLLDSTPPLVQYLLVELGDDDWIPEAKLLPIEESPRT
jgi:hypothetical protein